MALYPGEIRARINRVYGWTQQQKDALRDAFKDISDNLASEIKEQLPLVSSPSFTANMDIAMNSGEGITVDGDFGWRDITGQIRQRGTGSNDPDWLPISASAFSAYKFAVDDEVWIEYHVPHDYIPGSDFHIHAHWISDGADTTNTVKWQWDIVYADGYGVEAYPFATPTVVSAEEASGGQHYHMVTETTAVDGTGIEVDGMLYVRCRRVTNGATDNTDGIFLITSDVHYQSNNLATPNRNPNFYT